MLEPTADRSRARTTLDWPSDPLEVLRRWPVNRPIQLLHSGRYDPRWARWSIIAEPAGWWRFESRDGGRSSWVGQPPAAGIPAWRHHPFHDLRGLLDRGVGPMLGYWSYDVGRWIEKLPDRAIDDRGWPIVELAWSPGWAVFDHATGRWAAAGAWCDTPVELVEPSEPAGAAGGFVAEHVRPEQARAAVEAATARGIEYIAAGDVFQVNLAQRFTGRWRGETPGATREAFARLAAVSPAWYGAYLECPPTTRGPRALASTSPELFLQFGGEAGAGEPSRRVITRPIKGTRPASAPAEELARSEKDAAELHMIVDLLRNDLGRVCRYGSVRVEAGRVIESHPTVHHGVATISGELHESRDVVDLLRATLPGGSITGAPKVRAMEIIDELEPVRRGPYCGAIGWVDRDSLRLNIAIRTMLLEAGVGTEAGTGRIDFSVGGGVVADSEPKSEYEETLAKAEAMLRALRVGPDGAI